MTFPKHIIAVRPETSGPFVIAGPWPSYSAYKDLPEQARWMLYRDAKLHRIALEEAGFQLSESYGAFVARVCMELDL